MGLGGQRHAPAALSSGKTRYPLYLDFLYACLFLGHITMPCTEVEAFLHKLSSMESV
jgi:hypothetical protein